uniref:Uncharacterized protein n=1 Tax=Anguilla anguilla TaxID=7936 RepID=A0A0E9X886_ANGAN
MAEHFHDITAMLWQQLFVDGQCAAAVELLEGLGHRDCDITNKPLPVSLLQAFSGAPLTRSLPLSHTNSAVWCYLLGYIASHFYTFTSVKCAYI